MTERRARAAPEAWTLVLRTSSGVVKRAERAPASPPARNFAISCWRDKARVAEEVRLALTARGARGGRLELANLRVGRGRAVEVVGACSDGKRAHTLLRMLASVVEGERKG